MNIIKYLTNKEYRYHARKLPSIQRDIWKYEFTLNIARQTREKIRKERDRVIENKKIIEDKLAKEKTKELTDQLEQMKKDLESSEKEMKEIDNGIQGIPGELGYLEKLEKLSELRKMYKQYLQSL